MLQSAQTELFESDLIGELNHLKLQLIREGKTPLDLSMINPDIPPPRFLMDKLSEATIKSSNHRYSVSRGIRKLRTGFSLKYQGRFGVSLDPESDICVTMGTKDALVNTLFCLAQPGDRVLMGQPAYPAHRSACQIVGLTLEYFQLGVDQQSTLENIRKALTQVSPRILLLNFPNNPTGQLVGEDFFREVIQEARKVGCVVINDFVYGEMVYGNSAAASLLAASPDRRGLLEIYSLSKAYCIPGWRIGALMGDGDAIQKLSKLKSHIDYGIFLPLQIAAAAALTASQDLVGSTVAEYQRRSRTLMQGLQSLGWEVSVPLAGSSVWAKMPVSLGRRFPTGAAFLKDLLVTHGILAMPGVLFGDQFEQNIRFALVASSEQLYQLVCKLKSYQSQEEQPCFASP